CNLCIFCNWQVHFWLDSFSSFTSYTSQRGVETPFQPSDAVSLKCSFQIEPCLGRVPAEQDSNIFRFDPFRMFTNKIKEVAHFFTDPVRRVALANGSRSLGKTFSFEPPLSFIKTDRVSALSCVSTRHVQDSLTMTASALDGQD